MMGVNKDTVRLPDKPSELIMLALKDLNLVRGDDRYKIDMICWHVKYRTEEVCRVCLAGSVMAKTLHATIEDDAGIRPEFYETDTKCKLEALDNFRQGHVVSGLVRMNLLNLAPSSQSEALQRRKIWLLDDLWRGKLDLRDNYNRNPERFFRDMTDMANDLALIGL